MLSRAYCLRQNVQRVSRANKNTLSPKSTVRTYQIVRNQHVFVKRPAPRVTSRNVRSLELTQWNAQTRHFATISSTTPNGPGKVVGFFRILFKVGVGSCAVALIAVGYVLWTTLHPPELSAWPQEVRSLLNRARLAHVAGRNGEIVDGLTSLWLALHNTPASSLYPDPTVKVLGVAIWFADALEKDKQSVRAYRLLEEAIDLLQTRFKEPSVQKDEFSIYALLEQQAEMHDTSDITETRHLISIFLKLSSLSQSVEPRSETKWLTRAIRESIRLIPFLKGVNMSDYAQLLSDLEPFSGKEASFSELLNELAVQTKDKKDLTPVTEGDQVVPSAQVITADEVLDAEEVFPLPKWHVRDVISAIAIPLEKIGQYADKQGRRDIALRSYTLAQSILQPVLEPADFKPKDASIALWADLVHLMRITNRHSELHLRDLDVQTNAAEWLYRLHVAFVNSRICSDAMDRALKIYEAKNDRWAFNVFIRHGLAFEVIFEYGIAQRLAGTYFLNTGDLKSANTLLRRSYAMALGGRMPGTDVIDKVPAGKNLSDLLNPGEQKDEARKVEQALHALKQSQAEGKTSLRSHMNPAALKEWEEAVGQRPRLKEEETTQSEN